MVRKNEFIFNSAAKTIKIFHHPIFENGTVL